MVVADPVEVSPANTIMQLNDASHRVLPIDRITRFNPLAEMTLMRR
jgi:hypothetical protein